MALILELNDFYSACRAAPGAEGVVDTIVEKGEGKRMREESARGMHKCSGKVDAVSGGGIWRYSPVNTFFLNRLLPITLYTFLPQSEPFGTEERESD